MPRPAAVCSFATVRATNTGPFKALLKAFQRFFEGLLKVVKRPFQETHDTIIPLSNCGNRAKAYFPYRVRQCVRGMAKCHYARTYLPKIRSRLLRWRVGGTAGYLIRSRVMGFVGEPLSLHEESSNYRALDHASQQPKGQQPISRSSLVATRFQRNCFWLCDNECCSRYLSTGAPGTWGCCCTDLQVPGDVPGDVPGAFPGAVQVHFWYISRHIWARPFCLEYLRSLSKSACYATC